MKRHPKTKFDFPLLTSILTITDSTFTRTSDVHVSFTAQTVPLDETAVTLISLGPVVLLSGGLAAVLSVIVNVRVGRGTSTWNIHGDDIVIVRNKYSFLGKYMKQLFNQCAKNLPQ